MCCLTAQTSARTSEAYALNCVIRISQYMVNSVYMVVQFVIQKTLKENIRIISTGLETPIIIVYPMTLSEIKHCRLQNI